MEGTVGHLNYLIKISTGSCLGVDRDTRSLDSRFWFDQPASHALDYIPASRSSNKCNDISPKRYWGSRDAKQYQTKSNRLNFAADSRLVQHKDDIGPVQLKSNSDLIIRWSDNFWGPLNLVGKVWVVVVYGSAKLAQVSALLIL